MPVASYAPELMELYRRAQREPISIQLPSHAACTTLRFRLHNLRVAMRKESHPMLRIAEGVTISIRSDSTGDWLIARPSDADFLPALAKAGIAAELPEGLAPDPAGATVAVPAGEKMDTVLKDFLAHFDALPEAPAGPPAAAKPKRKR